ncbi:uncharacterized protein LOC110433181 isoform X6 [Sorghum bicolor]|nr:uncharacterized protein LOC110433181 isoform X6 [Sorghum bicolor]|eukprot:XP_021310626.1 uncharacterized protein LOC110433181 isoform X6 [Sorghum bicolor]
MDGDLVQRSKAIGFCYINSTMFFFMYANLNKSPAYGMSTELTMPTYNKSGYGQSQYLLSCDALLCYIFPPCDCYFRFIYNQHVFSETQKKLCESGKDPAVVTKISVSEGL